jgi:hypothetical protein
MSNSTKPRCDVSGVSSNIFAITAAVTKALKQAGMREQAEQLKKAVPLCKTYDDALQLILANVELEM